MSIDGIVHFEGYGERPSSTSTSPKWDEVNFLGCWTERREKAARALLAAQKEWQEASAGELAFRVVRRI